MGAGDVMTLPVTMGLNGGLAQWGVCYGMIVRMGLYGGVVKGWVVCVFWHDRSHWD